ncbi:BAX inhibitor 1 [Euphorbia peplus]|nr:BAX inhibitor 1 [Euphorbia peplus]
MNAFASFLQPQLASKNHRRTCDYLISFREISPVVQNHLKQVYLTLCCALAASAFLHIMCNIGGLLTLSACLGCSGWLLYVPKYEEVGLSTYFSSY